MGVQSGLSDSGADLVLITRALSQLAHRMALGKPLHLSELQVPT